MGKIVRKTDNLETKNFELIIIGGGIYGIMIALESARRGISTLLLEKRDFGAHTTLNHLKTVHGGLRYLQSADIIRFTESVKERRWFLKYLGEYVKPMPCVMPLYGDGLYKNSVFRAALLLNDFLSLFRNRGLSADKKIKNGKVISPALTKKQFNMVYPAGLKGSAYWFDAGIEEFQRLNMKLISTAADQGTEFYNYFKVETPLITNGKIIGITGTDLITKKRITVKSEKIINAAGPWSREIAERFDKDYPELFKKKILLWNILFDRKSLSSSALGLSTRSGKKHTYFFHPWKNRLLVGTGEKICGSELKNAVVKEEYISEFLDDLNNIVPDIKLKRSEILKVYSGFLPGTEEEKLSKRPSVIDHGKSGGPEGLYSVSGVKFTTSRLVADRLLRTIFPERKPKKYCELFKPVKNEDLFFSYDDLPEEKDMKQLMNMIDSESVIHLADLVIRRTSLGDNPKRAKRASTILRRLFSFDDREWNEELKRLEMEMSGKFGD